MVSPQRTHCDASVNGEPVPQPETDPATSLRMRGVRRTDTGAELALRKSLHSLGLRYRLHDSQLPGSPDLVFLRQRAVVFVHGCYWHRHEGCVRSTMPKRNREFWDAKFRANVRRDLRKESELEAAGWKVLIVWECEILRDSMAAALSIRKALRQAKGAQEGG